MKIAFVYDTLYPYSKGGGEVRFYEIGKRLTEDNFQVHLYGMKYWKGPDVINKDGIYYHGICPYKKIYTKEGRRSITQAIFFGMHCLKLIKEDFDVIDCCGFPYFSLFSCKLITIFKRKKLYSTWHEVWGKEYWDKYLGILGIFGFLVEKISSRLPDEIISVSELTEFRLKNELRVNKKIQIIPNGIDIKAIKKINPAKEESDVIYAGRLMDFKNVDILIKAIYLIKIQKPDIKCIIIGNGPEETKLKNLAEELNLADNIKFVGFLDQRQVYSYMKSSKIFVLPSTREGFGMVVIEANACGIPVITIDHKDNAAKDLIEEGENGYLCDLDEKEIAKRISNVFENGLDNKTKQVCVDSAGKYDWNHIVNEIERVYLI